MSPYFLELGKCFSSLLPLLTLFGEFGGDERDRTDDPLLAKQVLSQLSYTPIWSRTPKIKQRFKLVVRADLGC